MVEESADHSEARARPGNNGDARRSSTFDRSVRVGAYEAPPQLHRVVLQVDHVRPATAIFLADGNGGAQVYPTGGEQLMSAREVENDEVKGASGRPSASAGTVAARLAAGRN